MKQPVRIGVGVIIKKNGKVLFGKRIGSHGAQTWCLVGGHVEENESLEDCAKRESLEETGLVLKNVHFLTATYDEFKKEGKKYITIFLTAEIASGKLECKEKDKCLEWGWYGWQNPPKPLFLSVKHLMQQELPNL